MGRVLAGILGVAFACLTFCGSASALTAKLPVETSLSTVPASVSWPGSPDFEYRVDLTAGPGGAEFIFTVPAPSWGFTGVYGTPFSYGQPKLDGPGTLEPDFAVVADPAPWACWRGGFSGSQFWYRVNLGPGQKTTIVVPGSLAAAPLAGMTTETDFRIENVDDPVLIPAGLEVGGKQGVRIRTVVAGEDPRLPADRNPGRRFRLRGFTRPALADRKIRFRAEPVLSDLKKPLKPKRLVTVRTNRKGNFRTKPLRLHGEAIWKVTSKLVRPGRFARERNCGPVLRVARSR